MADKNNIRKKNKDGKLFVSAVVLVRVSAARKYMLKKQTNKKTVNCQVFLKVSMRRKSRPAFSQEGVSPSRREEERSGGEQYAWILVLTMTGLL